MQNRRVKDYVTFQAIHASGLANCEYFDLFKQHTAQNLTSCMSKKQTPQTYNMVKCNRAIEGPD